MLELIAYVPVHLHGLVVSLLALTSFLHFCLLLGPISIDPVPVLILQRVQLVDSLLTIHSRQALLDQVVDLNLIET